MKASKLDMLSKSEEIKMKDDEELNEFYAHLNDIVIRVLILGADCWQSDCKENLEIFTWEV